MNRKYLSKAKQLKPQLTQTDVVIDDKKTLKEGESAVFDFGNHYVGSITVQLSSAGSPQDAPALIKLKFCEIAKEIDENTSEYRGWISKSWLQEELVHVDVLPCELRLKRRYAFRYVKIEAVALSSKYTLVINKITAETVTSAPESVEPAGKTDRERLIDKIALRTLSECMQYEFEDGPKRDRRLWLGDLRLQALTNYATFKHNDLVKRCLYLFAGICGKNGELSAAVFTKPKVMPDDTFMFDYSLLFIPILQEYYEATNDRQTAEELLPLALKQLTLANESFENGIIKDSDKLGWCFLDWNLALNKQCGAQAVYIYCAKYAVKLLSALGKDTSTVEKDIAEKSQAAIDAFYNEEKGVFVSGSDKQISIAANTWMCLAGVFDSEKNAQILDRVNKTENAVGLVTPYAYHYYVQALINCGKTSQAREIINAYWGAMADDGADTFYEMFDPSNPDFSAYGAKAVNSYCHAWSCTPSYFLRRYFTEESNHFKKDLFITVQRFSSNQTEPRPGKTARLPRMVKGIIFDLDGVLLSTDEYHYQAWKMLADKLGIYFDKTINNKLRGVSRMASLDIILGDNGDRFTQEQKQSFAEEKNAEYRKLLSQMKPSDVADEVRSTLEKIRSAGIKTAIGSSSKNTRYIMERTEITQYFDAVSDGNNITKSKPDPEVFLKAAEYLGLKPQDCLVIEDAHAGIDAAKAGGFLAVAIGDAKTHEKADYKIGTFGELLKIIGIEKQVGK